MRKGTMTVKHMVLLFVFLLGWSHSAHCQSSPRWYKGNTHSHTFDSDGDSAPDDVVRWYREHGYDFLVITDHGMVTDVGPLNALFSGGGEFLVMRGEEVTSNRNTPQMKVHVNALSPQHKGGMGDSLIRVAYLGKLRGTRPSPSSPRSGPHHLLFSGCHWYPSVADDQTILEKLVQFIDFNPTLWQGK
jgi:hypothetical protein